MGPCLSAQQNRNVAASLVIIAHSMKSAANNPPKDVEGNLIELFEKADKSKFRFDEVISGGSYTYQKSGEKKEVEGLISDGIAEFKANPGKYVAIAYQTSMTDGPRTSRNTRSTRARAGRASSPRRRTTGGRLGSYPRTCASPNATSAAPPTRTPTG